MGFFSALAGIGTFLGGASALYGSTKSSPSAPPDIWDYLSKNDRSQYAQSFVTGSQLTQQQQQQQIARGETDAKYHDSMSMMNQESAELQLQEQRKDYKQRASESRHFAELLNPDLYKSGKELGAKYKDYMDESFPDVSQLSKLGISPQQVSQQMQSKSDSLLKLEDLKIKREAIQAEKYKAKIGADAMVASSKIGAVGGFTGSRYSADTASLASRFKTGVGGLKDMALGLENIKVKREDIAAKKEIAKTMVSQYFDENSALKEKAEVAFQEMELKQLQSAEHALKQFNAHQINDKQLQERIEGIMLQQGRIDKSIVQSFIHSVIRYRNAR